MVSPVPQIVLDARGRRAHLAVVHELHLDGRAELAHLLEAHRRVAELQQVADL